MLLHSRPPRTAAAAVRGRGPAVILEYVRVEYSLYDRSRSYIGRGTSAASAMRGIDPRLSAEGCFMRGARPGQCAGLISYMAKLLLPLVLVLLGLVGVNV